MKLSSLQKYILKQVFFSKRAKVNRSSFEAFYDNKKSAPAPKIRTNIITKSIERLIDKGLLVGFGEKTQYKLFINQVKFTPRGKKNTQKLFGQQTTLPFRKKR